MPKYRDTMKRGYHVMTPDGPGVIIGRNKRRSAKSECGCNQFVIKLEDGRKRHYSRPIILELNLGYQEMRRQQDGHQ